mmetsp:Transcript_13476/g.45630  ORF Transcript_13476/g.45630 Transcript_13476/m.45630 type:complete len:206 (-) Transcript_13476:339-956(-)
MAGRTQSHLSAVPASLRMARVQGCIIDEPYRGLPEPGSEEQSRVVAELVRREHRARISKLEVVHPEPGVALVHHRSPQIGLQVCGGSLPASVCGLGSLNGPVQRERRASLLWSQVAVPRAHREAVGLPHRGHAAHVDAHVELGDHAADDRELLPVLLAKVGNIRPAQVEELHHHRADAGEEVRAAAAAQSLAKPASFHAHRCRAS